MSLLRRAHRVLFRLSADYSRLKGMFLRVTNPFAMSHRGATFDLHALSTPPAFILSQDQTLNKKVISQFSNHNRLLGI